MSSLEKCVHEKIVQLMDKVNLSLRYIKEQTEIIEENMLELNKLRESIPTYYNDETLDKILINFLQKQHVVYDFTFHSGLAIGFVTLDPNDSNRYVFNPVLSEVDCQPDLYIYSTLVNRDVEYIHSLHNDHQKGGVLWMYVKQNTGEKDLIPPTVRKQIEDRGLDETEMELMTTWNETPE